MNRPATAALPLALTVLALALAAAGVWLDRSSLERGNRLYRAGATEPAARIYEAHTRPGRAAGAATYNAGTAALALGTDSAAAPLAAATGSADTLIAERAHYNLGYGYLSALDPQIEADSAVALLEAAIQHNRSALRLDPRLEDARFNLALAQAALDSVSQLRTPTEDISSPGEDDTPIDLASMSRGIGDAQSGIEPEDARASEVLGQRLAAAQGAREAWAAQDPGPIDEASARAMLTQVRHDPEQLIRGLMWSHRPDVAWWNAEPYPGGNW